MAVLSTFILDFQTRDLGSDSKIAIEILSEYRKICNFDDDSNAFALDYPVFQCRMVIWQVVSFWTICRKII